MPTNFNFSRRTVLGLIVAAAPFLANNLSSAQAATATSNPVILTVSGLVGDGTPVKFDRAALEALGMDSFETTTPWHTGKVKFEGVLMSTLLASVHAHGTTVFAKALDDYFSEIPVEDFTKYKVILALKRDGAYMPVSDQGPLFVIYPFDSDPILKDAKFQSRSVWQVNRIEVK